MPNPLAGGGGAASTTGGGGSVTGRTQPACPWAALTAAPPAAAAAAALAQTCWADACVPKTPTATSGFIEGAGVEVAALAIVGLAHRAIAAIAPANRFIRKPAMTELLRNAFGPIQGLPRIVKGDCPQLVPERPISQEVAPFLTNIGTNLPIVDRW